LRVKRTSRRLRPNVSADGQGVVSQTGGLLLSELADGLGLTAGLAAAFGASRRRQHCPGTVLRDLAVMLALGGDCLADLSVLRDQQELFGPVASDPTAWRTLAAVGGDERAGMAAARRAARALAWKHGAGPRGTTYILDIDSTLVTAHSDKERAEPTYKHGYGFHPMLCYLDGTEEPLASVLRGGRAAANDADDHCRLFDASVAALPDDARARPLLVRADSAGATHGFVQHLAERGALFSIGFQLRAAVRETVLAAPADSWRPAIRQNNEEREGAEVCELTGLDLTGWPEGTRAICRREEPHPGAQLTFSDINGFRFQVFITNQRDDDLAYLEARHRGHARVEDRIRCAKDTGLRNFPFSRFVLNEAWLEVVLTAQALLAWMQRICLQASAAARWEPKRLRLHLLSLAGRLVRSARQWRLRLNERSGWATLLAAAFDRVRRLPLHA
jgi:hypothetical protein